MKPKHSLPTPSTDAQLHSEKLTQRIKQQLNRQGHLSFAQFMQMALYTPGLGYYANSLPKIGAQGDFITAPEVSPLFSQCIARQAAQVLKTLEHPNLVEFGAGRGTMAKNILLELNAQEQPIEHYYILELSADLRLVQQETLQALPAHLFEKVIWLDSLPETPIEGVFVANEVLDAMPIERLKLEPHQTSQAMVVFNETKQQFEWDYLPITDHLLQRFSNGILHFIGDPSPDGYETEINLNIRPWLKSVFEAMEKGLLLLIDYGYTRREYYQPARVMGTLRCHYQHLAHNNPFFYPGLQDITAHVDFTAVAESAFDVGFKIAGFSTQAHFLMSSGLLELSATSTDDITESLKIAQQIKTLTLPDEMGETFKVIALTKKTDMSLMGFQLRDLRHQL
jgi:SAM-dependent MidA family methyltransferase